MATGLSLVQDAMLNAGILGSGETLDNDDLQLGLNRLNQMLDLWANENLMIYATVTESFTMTAGQIDYTTALLSSRPVTIDNVRVRIGNVDYEVDMVDQQTYDAIPYKTAQAIPNKCFYDGAYPIGTMSFYPVPNSAMTCFVVQRKLLQSVLASQTALSLPPGYEKAIIDNLAIELCPPFTKEPSQTMIRNAVASKGILKRTNYDGLLMTSVMDKSSDISNAFLYRGF